MATPEPPRFHWQGLDRHGKAQDGIVTATSLEQARRQLQGQGLRLTAVRTLKHSHTQPSPAAAGGQAPSQVGPGRHISDKQLVVFTRQLATMQQAGLPLLQSLDIAIAGATASTSTGNPALATLLRTVRQDVAQGDSLYQALLRHPRHFDALYCQLILAAEQAGLLDVMLDRIATHREKSLVLKGRVRAALAYPCAVVAVALAVTLVIMIWVVPSFEKMFQDFGAVMPPATQLLVNCSRLLVQHGHWLLLALAASGLLALHAWRRWPGIRQGWHATSLRLPLLGRLQQQAAIARWSRTFATLLAAGVDLPGALETAGGATGDARLALATGAVCEAVRDGSALHAAMRATGAFGELAVQMAAVGEQAGALDDMLARLAAIHEREVDDSVATLTTLMEPIIMAVLGVLIGGLVMVLYLPIFSLGSAV